MKSVYLILMIAIATSNNFFLKAMDSIGSYQRSAADKDVTEETVRNWLEADPSWLDKPDVPGGRTALFFAASKGRNEIVKFLLKKVAKVDIRFEADGMTPLLIATQRGHKSIVEELIIAGADVTTKNNDGENILHMAVYAAPIGGEEIIKLLKAKKPKEIKELAALMDNKGITAAKLFILYGFSRSYNSFLAILKKA